MQELKNTITELYEGISRLPTLEPNSKVSGLFEDLVTFCTQTPSRAARQLLMDAEVRALRPDLLEYCSKAEGLLEKIHAQRVLAADDTADDTAAALRDFPYYGEYRDLVRLEYHLLCGVDDSAAAIRRIAFIGSGSLPMTALLLAQEYYFETKFQAYDIDKEANGLAHRIVARLGDPVADQIKFTDIDAEGITEAYAEYDLVYLAALVGLKREAKRRIVAHLAKHMRQGALLLVRSAHGLRRLLYPVVKEDDLSGFRVLVTSHPGNHIVNSVIIARKM